MRRYPGGGPEGARRRYVSEWLRANAAFRRYILAELRRRGPLRARELEDRSVVSWKTGGWNDQTETSAARNLGQMLDRLWFRGEVMIVGRDGQQRIWDLAERTLPVNAPRCRRARRRGALSRQLRAQRRGTPSGSSAMAFDGRPPGWERALDDLVKEGVAVPARIDGLRGDWFAHADLVDTTFRPRTVLLSPFDDLVSDRNHTEQLFGFRFRLEIYVPKAKREFGYFVLPILRGDRLIGRIDPLFDRGAGVLRVHSVYAEEEATPADGAAAAKAIGELAAWLGASTSPSTAAPARGAARSAPEPSGMDRGVDSGSPMDEQAPESGGEGPDRAPNPDEQDSIDLRAEWRARHEGTTFRERMDRPDRYGLLLVLIVASLIAIAVLNDGLVERAVSVAVPGLTLVFALRTSRAPQGVFQLPITFVPLIVIVAFFVTRHDTQFAREAIATYVRAGGGDASGDLPPHVDPPHRFDATVLGGLCIYLLIGLLFSSVYSFLDAADSTQLFAQVPNATAADTLYFSYITMTTVGYGDLRRWEPSPDAGGDRSSDGPEYLVTAVALLVGNLGRERRRRQSR